MTLDTYIEQLLTELQKTNYHVSRNRGKEVVKFYIKKYPTSKVETKEFKKSDLQEQLNNNTKPEL